jgi:ABC-type transport system substrate-binding protein
MRPASRLAGRLCAAAFLATLAACGSSDDSVVRVAAIGSASDPFAQGPRIPPAGQLVRAATAEGLVAFDAEGRVVPALADRWIVTDDGRSYIFRLRDGTWRGGGPLTARAGQTALRSAIDGLKGSALGLDLAGVDDIRVMAGRVIEIRLTQPMPHLLQLLAQPELGLLEKRKGAGPMQLQRELDDAVLTPIDPEELGLPVIQDFQSRVRPLRFAAFSAEKAVARFNSGDADIVLGGQIADFPLARSVGILRGTIQLDPVAGLFGLAVANTDGFLATPENREALAMAIDRDALIAAFGVAGWTPSTRIVSPAIEGDLGTIGERWSALDLAERRALASSRVAQWRTGREGALRLRIALPTGPGADLLFTRLKQDLGAIGIEAVRTGAAQAADLRLIDEVARYPQATWYLNRFNCAVQRGLCNEAADERAAEARVAPDPDSRAALLAEAEAELTAANVFIPFGAPIRWSLVRSDTTGFAPNRLGWHPLMPMALRPK